MTFTNEHLSFSRLSRFEQCPQSFKLQYIERKPAEATEPQRFGKVVHAALERLFREVLEREHVGPLDEERAVALFGEAWNAGEMQGLALFTEGVQMVRAFVRAQGVVDHRNVLGVEQGFQLAVGPFSVLGFIDRIDRLDGETIEIVDYKTNRQIFTREELDGSLQLSLYEVAARRQWPWVKHVKLTFAMLRHGLRQSTSRSPEQLEATLAYVETLGRRTEQESAFPARLGTHCATCDQRKNCPAYANALGGEWTTTQLEKRDLEAIARERQEVAWMGRVFAARKSELEEVLREELRDRDELVLAGVRYTMTPAVTSVRYPARQTLRVLERFTGMPRDELVERVGSIDRDALEVLVREQAGSLTPNQTRLLRLELDALADRCVSPRFTAKEVRS